jgi:activator of HSP90 ATPase
MSKNEFTLSIILHATPHELYNAWLSSEGHSALTGSPAKVEGGIGGTFSAWDGYITGTTLELEPLRIVQSWRTTEFPASAPDSRLELRFEAVEAGTRLTLIHSELPEGSAESYKQGWEDFYFKPMREYFGG